MFVLLGYTYCHLPQVGINNDSYLKTTPLLVGSFFCGHSDCYSNCPIILIIRKNRFRIAIAIGAECGSSVLRVSQNAIPLIVLSSLLLKPYGD